jgi:hypothetical protein
MKLKVKPSRGRIGSGGNKRLGNISHRRTEESGNTLKKAALERRG